MGHPPSDRAPAKPQTRRHEFTIAAQDLDAAGKSFRFPVRAAWMRGALEDHEATAAGPYGELDVRASRSGNDVVVHGTLKASLSVPCARCLKPVQVAVDEAVSILFVPAPPSLGGAGEGRRSHGRHSKSDGTSEHELTAEEADTFTYDGETVVLDDLVRDELILETPTFPLCSEDCPGMSPSPPATPPSAGAEAGDAGDARSAVDPRLLPLLRIKRSMNKE